MHFVLSCFFCYYPLGLSSQELLVETMQDEAGNRRIGFGGRINLLRSYDLLLYRVFFDTKYLRKGTQVESQARKLIKTQVDSATDVGLYKELLLKLMTLIISIT